MKTEDLYQKDEDCCGCGMCANICPAKIIQMKSDELGFLYPLIHAIPVPAISYLVRVPGTS